LTGVAEGKDIPSYILQIKNLVKANAEDALKEVRNEEGWSKQSNNSKGKLRLYTKDYGDLLGVKAVCLMHADRDVIVETLNTQKLSKQSSKPKILEKITDDLQVYWMGLKVPIIKDRDFLLAQWECAQPNGAHLNTFVSVDHPLDPKSSKYVRGRIHMGAWHLDPRPAGGTIVTWVSIVDAAGNIPSGIKKMGAPAGAEAVLKLKELSEAATAQTS